MDKFTSRYVRRLVGIGMIVTGLVGCGLILVAALA